MIVPLVNEGLKNITIVVNMENQQLIKDFLDNSFKNKKLHIDYIIQKTADGPGGALKLTEKYIKKSVILLLGDTLCKFPDNYENSWIGVSEVSNKEKYKYCMIDVDKENNITKIIDKPKEEIKTCNAAVGIYFFKNYQLLKKVLTEKNKTYFG